MTPYVYAEKVITYPVAYVKNHMRVYNKNGYCFFFFSSYSYSIVYVL